VSEQSEQQVQQASDRFYQSLNNLLGGDPSDMEKVWSHRDDVSTMHPLGGNEVGWEQVWRGWQMASQAISEGQARAHDLRVFVLGDVAYTTGMEDAHATLGGATVGFDARCTNIYRKEGGEWKMIHHHTDTSPEAVDAVKRLMG
jgi:ketosteroid isomerase-like protein